MNFSLSIMKQMIRNTQKRLLPLLALVLAATFSLAAEEPATLVAPAPKQSGNEPSAIKVRWPGPAQVIPAIDFDGIPISEITKFLRDKCKGELDIILPRSGDYNIAGNSAPLDPGASPVHLSLRNVTAEEIFEAMNLLFSAEERPYRWDLIVNGSRPMAVLKPLHAARQPQEEPSTSVIYVGDSTSPNWPVEKMAEMVQEMVDHDLMAVGNNSRWNFRVSVHKPADIIVLVGSARQIAFAAAALQAIEQQSRHDQEAHAMPGVAGLPQGHYTTNSANTQPPPTAK